MQNTSLNQNRQKHSRISISDFEFLVKSMERGKQNLLENNNQNHLFHSMSMLNSVTDNHVSTFRCHEPPPSPNPHQIIPKFQTFMSLIEPVLESTPNSNNLKQLKLLSSEIKYFLDRYQSSGNTLLNSVVHQEKESYVKIINELQHEKDKLSNLVSQHQRANIKMYIKINEGESEEIEKYKKQLASLFQSYKKLQKMILSKSKKVKDLQNVCSGLKIQIAKRQTQFKYVTSQLEVLRGSKVSRQNREERETIQNRDNRDKRQASIKRQNRPIRKNKDSAIYSGVEFNQIDTQHYQQKIKQMQQVIIEQNNELERAYNKLKKLIEQKSVSSEKQRINSVQYQQKLVKKQKMIQDLNNQNVILDISNNHDQQYRMLLVQADALEQLIFSQ